jgi:hypothetical protein
MIESILPDNIVQVRIDVLEDETRVLSAKMS